MHDLQEGGKIMARLQCLHSHRIITYSSINSLGGEAFVLFVGMTAVTEGKISGGDELLSQSILALHTHSSCGRHLTIIARLHPSVAHSNCLTVFEDNFKALFSSPCSFKCSQSLSSTPPPLPAGFCHSHPEIRNRKPTWSTPRQYRAVASKP